MPQPADDAPAHPEAAAAAQPPVVVKKYANRRLYNTESSSYITLDTLADMVRHGRDFAVYDAKTAEDITRSVLTQIIVEEESKGRALLPTAFLRQLIGFYGDSMQALVPKYLEQAMAGFARQQESVRAAMQSTLGNFLPFGIEEVSRQNMAMMERAMTLFSPFTYRENDDRAPGAAGREPAAPEPQPAAAPTASLANARAAAQEREVAALRAEVAALRLALSQRGGRDSPEPTAAPAAPVSPASVSPALASPAPALNEPALNGPALNDPGQPGPAAKPAPALATGGKSRGSRVTVDPAT